MHASKSFIEDRRDPTLPLTESETLHPLIQVLKDKLAAVQWLKLEYELIDKEIEDTICRACKDILAVMSSCESQRRNICAAANNQPSSITFAEVKLILEYICCTSRVNVTKFVVTEVMEWISLELTKIFQRCASSKPPVFKCSISGPISKVAAMMRQFQHCADRMKRLPSWHELNVNTLTSLDGDGPEKVHVKQRDPLTVVYTSIIEAATGERTEQPVQEESETFTETPGSSSDEIATSKILTYLRSKVEFSSGCDIIPKSQPQQKANTMHLSKPLINEMKDYPLQQTLKESLLPLVQALQYKLAAVQWLELEYEFIDKVIEDTISGACEDILAVMSSCESQKITFHAVAYKQPISLTFAEVKHILEYICCTSRINITLFVVTEVMEWVTLELTKIFQRCDGSKPPPFRCSVSGPISKVAAMVRQLQHYADRMANLPSLYELDENTLFSPGGDGPEIVPLKERKPISEVATGESTKPPLQEESDTFTDAQGSRGDGTATSKILTHLKFKAEFSSGYDIIPESQPQQKANSMHSTQPLINKRKNDALPQTVKESLHPLVQAIQYKLAAVQWVELEYEFIDKVIEDTISGACKDILAVMSSCESQRRNICAAAHKPISLTFAEVKLILEYIRCTSRINVNMFLVTEVMEWLTLELNQIFQRCDSHMPPVLKGSFSGASSKIAGMVRQLQYCADRMARLPSWHELDVNTLTFLDGDRQEKVPEKESNLLTVASALACYELSTRDDACEVTCEGTEQPVQEDSDISTDAPGSTSDQPATSDEATDEDTEQQVQEDVESLTQNSTSDEPATTDDTDGATGEDTEQPFEEDSDDWTEAPSSTGDEHATTDGATSEETEQSVEEDSDEWTEAPSSTGDEPATTDGATSEDTEQPVEDYDEMCHLLVMKLVDQILNLCVCVCECHKSAGILNPITDKMTEMLLADIQGSGIPVNICGHHLTRIANTVCMDLCMRLGSKEAVQMYLLTKDTQVYGYISIILINTLVTHLETPQKSWCVLGYIKYFFKNMVELLTAKFWSWPE